MGLTFEQVKTVDLTPLAEAVAGWKKLPGAFTEIQRSFGSTVTQNLRDSDWTGEAAEAAYATFTVVERELYAAAEEARDVHGLLSNAHSRFEAAQKTLRDVESAVAGDRYMRISAAGVVHLVIPPEEADQSALINKSYSDAVHTYNDRVKQALADADEADEALHYALGQDHNGRERGFDAGTANSVDAALAQRKAADKDVEAALGLARSSMAGKTLSVEETERLHRLLAAHEGDPYFAERFAVALGPRGTVDFWESAANRPLNYSEKEKAALADLQKSLGYTLATASHSDSPAMEGWKKDMVAIGPERVNDIDYRKGTLEKGPYGYQVMSSLLRYGQYDTEFLKQYGKELLAFEQGSGTKVAELWRSEGAHRLNPAGTDRGQDPVAGYMEALGHNPEAAKALFHSDDRSAGEPLDSDLRYLLTERTWPDDPASDQDKETGAGWDELGHALEAATLGTAYDQLDQGARRDAVTADIMEQVVSVVASDTNLVKNRPGIEDSLARMGAGYIDDLNWGLAHEGLRTGSADPDEVFGTGPGHMTVQEGEARKFLHILGHSEEGYQILSSAQYAFTGSAMAAYPDDLEKARMASNAGAFGLGALTEGRISEINHTYEDAEAKANLEYQKSAAWKEFGLNMAVSAGVGVAVTPFLGPAAGVAAQTVVPLLVDAGSSALGTYWGNEFSEDAMENEADYSSKAALDSEQFAELSVERAQSPLLNYLELHDVPPGTRTDLLQEALNAHDRGSGKADATDGDK